MKKGYEAQRFESWRSHCVENSLLLVPPLRTPASSAVVDWAEEEIHRRGRRGTQRAGV